MKLFTLSSVLLFYVTTVFAANPFDCRRLFNCANSAMCDVHTGICTCPTGFSGDKCDIPDGSVCPVDPSPCQNGATCYDDGAGAAVCSCPNGYLGVNCEISSVVVECDGTTIKFDLSFPEPFFSGLARVFPEPSPPTECGFNEVTANGITTTSLTINIAVPSDGTTCGSDYVTLDATGATGDVYERLVIIQYLQTMVTAVDEIINGTCTHQSGDIFVSSDITSINLNTDLLPSDDKPTTYSPVALSLLDKDSNPMSADTELSVGDEIFLQVTIEDTTVFKNVFIVSCEATNPVNAQTFTMFSDGCPTKQGKKTIELQTQSDTTDADGNPLIRKQLKVNVFKFYDANSLLLTCNLKLCKEGETDCVAPTAEQCEDIINNPPVVNNADNSETTTNTGEDTTANDAGATSADNPATTADPNVVQRRRRAADDESSQTVSTILKIRGPSDYNSASNTGQLEGATVENCLERSEIMAVLIILACVVCILFIACFILAVCLIRRRKLKQMPESETYRNERFQIPRAHVNEAYREM